MVLARMPGGSPPAHDAAEFGDLIMSDMTPNERFGEIGTSTRAVADRIVRVWERATSADVESGARWYADGETFIATLAGATSHSQETVAAVVAHLSPRTTWQRNMQGADLLLTTGEAPGCIGANVERAREAMTAADPLGTLNGPKTSRFAR